MARFGIGVLILEKKYLLNCVILTLFIMSYNYQRKCVCTKCVHISDNFIVWQCTSCVINVSSVIIYIILGVPI